MNDLVFLSASQLAAAIRDREVTAVAVLEAHLRQIERYNPALNAIATLATERAREQARQADLALAQGQIWGPLHGVPMTCKDNFETAGLRTTCGYPPLANYVPQRDATVVAQLRNAGAILLGKTNMPSLGTGLQTRNALFGCTSNPWNLAYTCGGSTGGGAAAIAAGLSPLESGSDSGGSIRVPAHFCGVFGFKPTEHRVSTAGHLPELPGKVRSLRQLLTAGVLARSIDDLQLWLALVEGPDDRQWDIPPVTEAMVAPRSLVKYRFAVSEGFADVPVSAETRSMLQQVTLKLTAAGCSVAQVTSPEFDFTAAWECFGELAAIELYSRESAVTLGLWWLLSWFASAIPGGPISRGYVHGARLSLKRYSDALAQRDALIAALTAWFKPWDAWICPVCPIPAFGHTWAGKPLAVDTQTVSYVKIGCAYTAIFNLTGNPVVVVPVTQSQTGLPLGIQIVGHRWRDRELLALAAQLTKITGSFRPPPGYAAA